MKDDSHLKVASTGRARGEILFVEDGNRTEYSFEDVMKVGRRSGMEVEPTAVKNRER